MAAARVGFKCYVGGLALFTTDSRLSEASSTFGQIIDYKIILDRETGKSHGFGFVTFVSEKAMRDAIEGMNGQNLDGSNITVKEAQAPTGGSGYVSGGDDDGSRYDLGGGGGSRYGPGGGSGYGSGGGPRFGPGGNIVGYEGGRREG